MVIPLGRCRFVLCASPGAVDVPVMVQDRLIDQEEAVPDHCPGTRGPLLLLLPRRS